MILSEPWALAATIALLIAYRWLSGRYAKIPSLPIGLLVVYFAFSLANMLIPEGVLPALRHWLDVIAVIALYCAAFRILFAATVELWLFARKKEALPKITRDFVLLGAYAVIAFMILSTKGGVNLAGLITTSAVLTAVIGLAAQNTLGNLFAGASLQLERPYGIGDWIQYGVDVGRVVGIGWKSTRLMTFENELVFVPNLDIVKTVVKNFSKPSRLHVMKIDIGVEYGAAPSDVRRVMLGVLREEPRILKNPTPQVRLTNFGDFAITYQLRFTYDDYGNWPELRASIMNRVWYALKREGIRIPFPIRDVQHRHIERRAEAAALDLERECARAQLESVSVLAPLSAPEKDLIARRMRIAEYCDGEAIVHQGEAGDSMYVLYRGACDVTVGKGEAPSITVATLRPPSFFGEMSLLTGEPRSATVRARGDSVLFAIDKALFGEVLAKDTAMLERLAEIVAKRQADTAQALDQASKDRPAQVQGIARRIRSFFGL
jgi:small-conductance mechanosensitive channel/CRP-like cAMP-binding protein